MSTYTVQATQRIAAPAAVCHIIADYRQEHPKMLPPDRFSSRQFSSSVGTVISFEMPALGRTRHFKATITEPAPGRVLAETDPATGTVTTFTVEPEGSAASTVTIATTMNTSNHWLSWGYSEELVLLATVSTASAARS